MSIFEKILKTPKSAEFIRACIEHGADLYSVSSIFENYDLFDKLFHVIIAEK